MTLKTKIESFQKFFGKKELGIKFYSSLEEERSASLIPLKILKARPMLEKEISEIPIEANKVVHDSIRVKPKTIEIEVLVNDDSGALLIGNLSSFLPKDEFAGNGEVRDTLQMLDELINSTLFITCITLTRTIKNMQLLSYDYEENVNGKDKHLILNLKCREILTFEVQTEGADASKVNLVTINPEPESGLAKVVNLFT